MATKGERIREHILSSADQAFYQFGYTATAFSRLAECAGIPKGNFYYYYKTKDAILEDVLQRRLQLIQTQLVQWNQSSSDPRKRILCFIQMLMDNADNLSRLGCPIGTINAELGKSEIADQKLARSLIVAYVDWLREQFSVLVNEEQAQGLALHLMVMAEGAALLAHAYGDQHIIELEAERMKTWLYEQVG